MAPFTPPTDDNDDVDDVEDDDDDDDDNEPLTTPLMPTIPDVALPFITTTFEPPSDNDVVDDADPCVTVDDNIGDVVDPFKFKLLALPTLEFALPPLMYPLDVLLKFRLDWDESSPTVSTWWTPFAEIGFDERDELLLRDASYCGDKEWELWCRLWWLCGDITTKGGAIVCSFLNGSSKNRKNNKNNKTYWIKEYILEGV